MDRRNVNIYQADIEDQKIFNIFAATNFVNNSLVFKAVMTIAKKYSDEVNQEIEKIKAEVN